MNLAVLSTFNAFKVTNRSLPILAHLLVEADRVVKTDLDRTLIYYGQPFGEMRGLLEAKQTAVVKATYGGVEDFPKVSKLPKEPEAVITIAPTLFLRMVNDTARFVSEDDNRMIMTGVLWEVKNGKMTVTSSDGKRLYREAIAVDAKSDKGITAVVDIAGCVGVLKKIMSSGTSMVVIEMFKDKTVINMGAFELRIRHIDGEFPNTEPILTTSKECIIYNAAGLAGAVKYLKQFSGKDKMTVKLHANKAVLDVGVYENVAMNDVTPKDNKEVKGTDFNPCLITMTMQSDENDKALASFNLEYLADAVNTIGDTAKLFICKKDGYSFWDKACVKEWI